MLAKDLIDRLERLGLLDQEIIEALREQLAQSGARATPEAVAKLLVDNGQLTRFQATKLIGELRNSEYADQNEAVVEVESDDLVLLDGDEAGEVVEVEEAIAVDGAMEAVAVFVSEDEVATAVAVEGVGAGGSAGLKSGSNRPRKVNPNKKVADPNRSVWDSFKIYGVSALILILLFLSVVLYLVLSKGNADDFIKKANEQYTRQVFAEAEKSYAAFLKQFGEANPHSSIARTRMAMSQLYLFAEYRDPTQATKEAERILPTIEAEPGLDEERNNLAAYLVEVADNIAEAAVDAKETEQKQSLLAALDRQIKLTENSVYVSGTARASLAGRLLGISETRAKVQRDINRNLRLDETVAGMDADIKAQKTKDAYDKRSTLLREFPELEKDQRLVELVVTASAVQQKLVTKAVDLPTVTNESLPADSVKSIVLTNRSGNEVPGLVDEVVYTRVHGAILAFSAVDGKLLWRRYVGNSEESMPIPVNPGGQEGALLSDTTSFEVQRADSKTGTIQWRIQFGEEFSQPVAYDGIVYLSTRSGTLVAFDTETGEPRWATKIPQPLEESPGISSRFGKLYLAGEHSNLYVIDKRTGECSESFYIGHAKGTVSVPPITLEGNNGGHVFVIENAGTDYSLLHILKCNAEGGALAVAQPPQRLVGNVHVPPIMVLGRRLIILTDRGQIKAFDIEQSAAVAEQVKESAEQVASYDAPTSVRMAVGKNQMWVTGTRIRRFELQVSTGRVNPGWLMHEGDSFIGTPYLIGEALVHARVLKGTTGVRVSAVDPVTGQAHWQTDVGVPVSMLTSNPGNKSFHAVTSQAALFELDAQSVADGATSGPIENPGGAGISMRFEHPLWVDQSRAVFVNLATSGQICVYDATRAREKLRLMTLALPPGKIGGNGAIAGEGLMLPLESGRVVYMDWQTGGPLGSPFQPASAPNNLVRWTTPVVLSNDASQVVIADDRKKMYRLRVAEQVRDLASVDLPEPLLVPLCQVGDKIVGSTSGPAADFLLAFNAESLAETTRVLLDGRITWGPFAAGDRVVLQTDDGMLRTFDSSGKAVAPPVALDAGPLIPGVKLVGSTMIVLSRQGWLMAIDQSTGAAIGKVDFGQPLSALPLEVGKRLLVPGAEGLIYVSEIPTGDQKP